MRTDSGSEPAPATDRPAIFDLDPERVGEAFIRLALTSYAMGHSWVRGTARPYLSHPETMSPESRFIADVIALPVYKIIDRWYGGPDGALEMNAVISANLLGPASE